MPEGTPLGGLGWQAVIWAVLGAIAGGILLNLMPCVFPILALKALHISRAGGDAREARFDALAYAAGAIVGTGALGAVLLAIRAAGSEAGWAFQLQDPRTIMLLLLLAVAITANLLGLFELPVLGGAARPAGSFGTGALAAFVATPCAGPFLGAALGTALLLPLAGSVLVFAALGAWACACRSCSWRSSQRFAASLPQAGRMDAAPAALPRHPDGRRARSPLCGCFTGRRVRSRSASGLPPRLALVALLLLAGQRQRAGTRAISAYLQLVALAALAIVVVPGASHVAGSALGSRTLERGAGRELRAAGQPGVRLFHRRLVP